MCIHTHDMHVHEHMITYMHTSLCVQALRMHTYKHACMCTHAREHTHANTSTQYANAHIKSYMSSLHTCLNANAHTHTHTHTHTNKQHGVQYNKTHANYMKNKRDK